MTVPQADRSSDRGDPLVAAGFSDWTGKLVDAVGRSFWPVLALQLVVAVPTTVLEILLIRALGHGGLRFAPGQTLREWTGQIQHPGQALGFGIAFVVVAAVLGCVVQLGSAAVIVRQAAGGPAALSAAMGFGLRRFAPLLGWTILAGLIIAVGFALLLVPGIVLAVIIVPTLLGAIAFERARLSRCFQLAAGRLLMLFGRSAMMVLFFVVYAEIASAIATAITGSSDSVSSQLLQSVLELPLQVVLVAFMVVTYAEVANSRAPTTTGELVMAVDGSSEAPMTSR